MSSQAKNVLEAERLLIGAMLLNPDKAQDVAELVSAGDFLDKRAKAIAGAIFALASKPEAWDLIAVKSTLRAWGVLDQIGGAVTLAEYGSASTSSAYAFQHARMVRNAATLRALAAAGGEIAKSAAEANPADPQAVSAAIELAEAQVYAASHIAAGEAQMQSVDGAAMALLKDLDGAGKGWTTGYYDLDALLIEMRPKEFHGIAGRPGTGKTALALNLLGRLARQGAKCLYCSLEMSVPELTGRLLGLEAEVQGSRMRRRTLTSEDRVAIEAAANELGTLPIRLFEDSGSTVGRIAAQARRAHREMQGLDFIFVDYVQLMTDPAKKSEYETLSAISKGLKGLARELNVVLVGLIQFNREADEVEPKMRHLRGSGSFEQDLDGCILLHKTAEHGHDTDEIMAILAKWRHGSTGRAPLLFRKHFGRFENPTLGRMELIN